MDSEFNSPGRSPVRNLGQRSLSLQSASSHKEIETPEQTPEQGRSKKLIKKKFLEQQKRTTKYDNSSDEDLGKFKCF